MAVDEDIVQSALRIVAKETQQPDVKIRRFGGSVTFYTEHEDLGYIMRSSHYNHRYVLVSLHDTAAERIVVL